MSSDDDSTGEAVEGRSLHQRARDAVRVLVGRQVVLQFLALAGGIVVARILGPGPIGVFGIALFVVNIAGLFADLGMRTALIRQSAVVTERQLAACFTLQQVLVTLIVVLLFIAAPAVSSLYTRAPAELASLLRLLALDLYLRSWRSMSEIRLEQSLRYRPLAAADIAGSTGYQLTAVALVLSGVGAHALAWAMIAGNVVRVALIYRKAPWPLRFVLTRADVVPLLRAGLPVQANQVVTQMPAWVTPTLVAGLIGPDAVGFLTWASSLGRKPREVLENAVRVSIPHFARLQSHLPEVERVFGRYALLSLLACAMWVAVILIAGRELVALVYGDRWIPAVPALLIYAASTIPASIRGLASAALIGIGRAHYAARAATAAAAVSVLSSALLVLWIGFLGVPIGQLAGVIFVTPWLLRGIRPGAERRILRAASIVLVPVGISIAGGLAMYLIPLSAAVSGLLGAMTVGLLFVVAAWRVGPPWLRATVREEAASLRRLVRVIEDPRS